ncbi:MAG TPA: sulfatase [Solirubrobacterales bacterium]|nr:sulfatase [Solirubrobacterales bacterium]
MDRFEHPKSKTPALVAARLALAASLLVLFASFGFAIAQERADAASPAPAKTGKRNTLLPAGQKPNFVVIQTDDQTLDQLYAEFTPPGGAPIQAMPYTLGSIAAKGITFNRFYDSYPLCCPSRVTTLTGRYAHNHNVRGNVPPNGGSTGFGFRQANNNNIATWLQGAGYRTVHIGKFLNGYGDEPYDAGNYVPPGWSSWHSVLKADTHHYFYGYSLNDNGTIDGPFGDSGSWETREYGERDDFGCPAAPLNGKPCLYLTDVMTRIAWEELLGTAPGQPFYMQVDYTAPHGDFRRPAGPEPATRHYDSFAGAPYPHDRSQGFNEGNVNDKPRFIREAGYLSPTETHTYRVYYQKALESLRAVDEGVQQIINTLGAMGQLRNTYVIFTSDNGFFYGEHRLTGGKFLAYEPATHLPFLMRGPGIKPGTATGELAGNIDIAPTILELAGATATKSIDGRSLVPYMVDPALRTRRPLLFESFVETADVEQQGGVPLGTSRPNTRARASSEAGASIVAPPKDYVGIRLGPWKYIEWPSGEKELYDITKDPYELNNKARDTNFYPIRGYLHRELTRLIECVGKKCQTPAEKAPLTLKEQREIRREQEKKQREREKREKEREQKKQQGQK